MNRSTTSMVPEQAGQRGRFVVSGRSALVAAPSNSRQRARAVSLLRLAKKPKWRMRLAIDADSNFWGGWWDRTFRQFFSASYIILVAMNAGNAYGCRRPLPAYPRTTSGPLINFSAHHQVEMEKTPRRRTPNRAHFHSGDLKFFNWARILARRL